ncbi:Dynein heavy chain 3, axonemal, related [Eimeria necatrix]|uniref:Dynein heavy chain 3, axonemal, related n=1 Tax=Eimeria necatrix TaxID=51315 RepID=U6MQP6_9EIME|nr:Dynein heavy chain 3, axonemal, related [Eimeria necatrix]CDJ66341.1 Dynein heavy chain 3, axonemal, related [Eimeria necatrix]
MLTYAGPFTVTFREELKAQWSELLRLHQLPFQASCGLKQFLGDPVTIRQWIAWGLPNDELSIQNGIIMDRARRWPLMIDPQSQANRFIKRSARATEIGFEVFKLSDAAFMRELELSIQLGKWVLIENVSETLDPALDPVLLQQKTKSGSGYCIRLGEKPIPWGPSFKLFMTTKLPNPKFSVDTFVKTTVINFAITPEGLEDQMLGLVVTKEAPQLEERKAALAQSNADMRRELKDLQDKILQVMSQSQGNILDDEVLLNTLAASKQTSEEIQEKVQEAEVTEREIDEARQCYRKVAARCSQLFFCLVELAGIEPMYQYSQQWFQNLISLGISEAAPTPNVEQRTQLLVDHLSYLVYQNVSRSLFVRHKLLFAFALSLRVQAKTPVDPAELRFLLTGTVAASSNTPNPTSWLTEKQWQALSELSHLRAFEGLASTFQEEEEGFRRISDSLRADQEPLPGRWKCLNSIQKMCILRILRMDSLTAAASSYIESELGARFLEPPPFDLAQCYKDSTSQTPLIFILSQGSDPISELLSFAKDMKMSRRFESISLGQGQGPKAAKLIEEGCNRGGWVLLQNCHLAASWMSELERICEQWNPEEIHRDFRLWLTSMPSSSFPVSVLQVGVKMTNEPPKGLKANLQRLYAGIDNRQLNATQQPTQFKRLYFALCFFHAIVTERRRFGPIGWNIYYEFTQDDLVVCQRQLRIFMDASEKIPFKVLRFLGAQINYGGRVTDANDKRLIDVIADTYVNERLIIEGASYKFSKSGIYYCPEEGDLEGFQKYIQSLPSIDQPEVFGLHENANINCAQMEGKELLDGILSMAPRSSSAGSTSRESAVSDVASYVQSIIPDLFDVEFIQQKYPTRYDESMNTVVVQESIRYNGLLAIINKTIKDLRLAIRGQIVMTEELEKIAAALFDNQVPKVWSDRGFVSMKPLGSWLKDLTARLSFLRSWIDQGPPKCFWMAGLFFPQAFLTGVLQNYARKYRVAVDRLSFAFTILKDKDDSSIKQAPEDGCFVQGIFLEGCRWDSDMNTLVSSRPKILFEELPVLWFLPQEDRVQESTSIYMCPLYKVPSRKGTLSTTGHSTNYITSIELPCIDPPDVPIKAGVAALLALQD